MRKKSRIIDIGLILLILLLGGFLVSRLRVFIKSMQEENNPSITAITQTDAAEAEPTDEVIENYSRQLGIAAPDFSLETMDGEMVALSDYLGMPVMINFWATWCPPCTAEMPLIDEFAELYVDELVVLAVNAGEKEADVRDFSEAYDFHMTFLLDPANSTAAKYYVFGYPSSVFVDDAGLLQAMHVGELDDNLLSDYLNEIGVGK